MLRNRCRSTWIAAAEEMEGSRDQKKSQGKECKNTFRYI